MKPAASAIARFRIPASCLRAAAVLGVALAVGGGAQGQCDLDTLLASDACPNDRLGFSADFDGTVVVAGAPWAPGGSAIGTAYVYRLVGELLVEEAILTASDGTSGSQFSWSVSVSGDVVVVGAYLDDPLGTSSGSAYVYRFDRNLSQWVEEQKLTSADGAEQDMFGFAVSVDGDVAVIGAPRDDDDGDQSGSAYVFRYDGISWNEEVKLTASDAEASERFGRSLALEGEVAVIAASKDDDLGMLSGSAYVFRHDGTSWNEEAKLTASDGTALANFGWSSAICGEVIVIGAQGDANETGAAYVYRFDGIDWNEEAKLTATDGSAGDHLGWSVSCEGDTAVVGAWGNDAAAPNAGSAYVHRFNGVDWGAGQKLTAPQPVDGDSFGTATAFRGGAAIIGASFRDDAADNAGALYTLDVGCLCPADVNGDGAVGVTDLLDLLAVWGTDPSGPPDLDGDDTVGVTDLLELLAEWGPCA